METQKTKIILAADHRGFVLKEHLKDVLKEHSISFDDLSPELVEGDDFPAIAFKAAKKVVREKARGVFICGTGIGMCIAANKVKGVRAAMAYDEDTARLSRQDNDSNILCLGGRTMKADLAKKILMLWIATRFLEGRHLRRVEQISKFESEN